MDLAITFTAANIGQIQPLMPEFWDVLLVSTIQFFVWQDHGIIGKSTPQNLPQNWANFNNNWVM